MDFNKIRCPVCQKGKLLLKYEAKYVYSYRVDTDAPGTKNTNEFFSYLYDNREQKESAQFIECDTCGARHPCVFSLKGDKICANDLGDAISALGGRPNNHFF